MKNEILESALPQGFKDMEEVIAASFQRQGMCVANAHKLARVSAFSLMCAFGGECIYLPSGPELAHMLGNGHAEGCDKSLLWEKVIPKMARHIAVVHEIEGETAERAQHIARESLLALAHYFGGRSFYLSRGDAFFQMVRDKEILRRLGKERAASLAREFGVSTRNIWRIVKNQLALERAAAKRVRE